MRYYSICLMGLCVTSFFFHPTSARAQGGGDPAQLSAAAQAAKPSYKALGDVEVAAARQKLQAAFDRLNRYLGNGANAQGWRSFLKLADLREQLQGKPDLEKLEAIRQQFASDYAGLEMPVFSNVGTAVREYLEALQVAANAQGKTQYEGQLDALSKALESYRAKPTEADARTINDALALLQATHQAPELVRSIHAQYSQPNLWVQISEPVAGAGINKDLDEMTSINDVILGADVHGKAHTTGKLSTELVPSKNTGVLETVLVGRADSRSTANKGPATVNSKSVTTFTGRKRITVDADGFKGYAPCVNAETHSTILDICVSSRLGLVQRMAEKKTYQSKPDAEAEAASHAEARVRRRIDEEAVPSLAKANKNYKEKFRDPLVRAGAFPELLKFASTDSNLYVTGLAANKVQVAAPTAPPDMSGSYDLSVRLHESAANNMADSILAGKTITDESVAADAKRIWGKVPEELQLEPDAEPWSMTFTAEHPVMLQITDGGFKVTVCGQRYTSGDRKLPAMNVSATYKVERSGKGSKAVRQGDLEILPPGYTAGQRLSNQQIALRALLQKRFGKLLKPEMVSEGLKLPGKWEQAGLLVLKDLNASDSGWLSLGWQRDTEPPAAPVAQSDVSSEVAGDGE